MKRLGTTLGLDNLIRATGGASGIMLFLWTPSHEAQEDGIIVSVYAVMKVDAGPGPVVMVDPKGALFNGQPSWELRAQFEWAIFSFYGAGWDVFAKPGIAAHPRALILEQNAMSQK
jgi:hypothetical protein